MDEVVACGDVFHDAFKTLGIEDIAFDNFDTFWDAILKVFGCSDHASDAISFFEESGQETSADVACGAGEEDEVVCPRMVRCHEGSLQGSISTLLDEDWEGFKIWLMFLV